MYQKKVSTFFFILFFFLGVLHSQTDPLGEIQRLTEALELVPPAPERRLLLQNRAMLYEMLGQIEEAREDYRLLWENFGDWRGRTAYLRLDYEMGKLEILEELSSALMDAPLEHRIDLLVLESRLLLVLGHWERVGELLIQYESIGLNDPSYLYERFHYHQLMGELEEAHQWQELLQGQQASSPENYIIQGLAQERVKPSNLMGYPNFQRQAAYYYQVGAFRDLQTAREMQVELQAMNIESQLIERDSLYKILVPSSPVQDSALLDSLNSLGIQPFRVSE